MYFVFGGDDGVSTHLDGKLLHRAADAPLEQAAPHHHRARVVAELLLQLVVLQLAGSHARNHLTPPAGGGRGGGGGDDNITRQKMLRIDKIDDTQCDMTRHLTTRGEEQARTSTSGKENLL